MRSACRRLLSSSSSSSSPPLFGRPFALSKQEALQCFTDWETKFLPTILRTISQRNVTIQPILLPFYGYSMEDGSSSPVVRYGGSDEYPFSDLLVTAAKTDPSLWTSPFDESVLKMKDIAVVSRWCPPPPTIPVGVELKRALLPAYLVHFLHTKKATSTAIVGAETGRVSALREHTVTTAKREIQRALRVESNLVFLFPPLAVALFVWATLRLKYSHRVATMLSKRADRNADRGPAWLADEFCVLDEPLTKQERQEAKKEQEEQAYQRQNERRQRQERINDMLRGGGEGRLTPDAALATLGLQHGASQDEIRSAYRKQLLKYHPDHFKGGDADESAKRTQEIIRAYRLLQQR